MKTLLIYTGGTIGMMENPENGSLIPLNFNELQNYIPELRKFANDLDVKAFETPIDSSDVNVATWQSIASIIEENYDQYSGFVILHGTDTMAYTASALSFMLDGLAKPVILTGSQLPIGRLRTDGKENLITAIEIATARRNGEPVIQEVAVLFDSKLFRGNRTHKFSTENFDAFSSPNYDDLASIGIHILYNHQKLLRKKKPIERSFGISNRRRYFKNISGHEQRLRASSAQHSQPKRFDTRNLRQRQCSERVLVYQ
jgi:L-asparaginase